MDEQNTIQNQPIPLPQAQTPSTTPAPVPQVPQATPAPLPVQQAPQALPTPLPVQQIPQTLPTPLPVPQIAYPQQIPQQIPQQPIPTQPMPQGYFPYQIYPPAHPEIPVDPMSELQNPEKKHNKFSLIIVSISLIALSILLIFGYPYIKGGLSKGITQVQKNEEQNIQEAPKIENQTQFETEVESTLTEKPKPVDKPVETPDPNGKEFSATVPEANEITTPPIETTEPTTVKRLSR